MQILISNVDSGSFEMGAALAGIPHAAGGEIANPPPLLPEQQHPAYGIMLKDSLQGRIDMNDMVSFYFSIVRSSLVKQL